MKGWKVSGRKRRWATRGKIPG